MLVGSNLHGPGGFDEGSALEAGEDDGRKKPPYAAEDGTQERSCWKPVVPCHGRHRESHPAGTLDTLGGLSLSEGCHGETRER